MDVDKSIPKVKKVNLINVFLIAFFVTSCISNNNVENKSTDENLHKFDSVHLNIDSSQIQAIDIEEEREFIKCANYAQWETPHVEIEYDDRSYLNPSLIIKFYYGERKVFQLFETGMFKGEIITLDTIRFGNGKYPELIVNWHTDMWHNYGPLAENNLWAGGWEKALNGLSIWDLNEQKCLFSSLHHYYNYEDRGEVDTTYLDECYWDYKVTIDTLNKTILLDSLDQKYIGECFDSVDLKMGIYYFDTDTFIRK